MKIKRIIAVIGTILFMLPSTLSYAELLSRDNMNLYISDKYDTTSISKKYSYMQFNDDNNNCLSDEVIEKRKSMENYETLEPKTEARYEIALAYSDGSYEYIESSETLEEARVIANSTEVEEGVLPAVINNEGNVVYSTNAMGRVIVYRSGDFMGDGSETSIIYEDSNTLKEYTYIHQDYMDDVPIIEQALYSSKIQISGYTGWIKTDDGLGNYDLIVIPMNQVKDPSFYYVENGFLYHYVSTDMTKEHISVNDWDPELGQAPNYMKEGIKYFSYDGNYFYTGSTDIEALNKLINDLKNGTNINAINYNNKYFNYYNLLSYRSKSEFTAEELNWVINDHIERQGIKNSKIVGIGKYLIEAQNKYGVNATLILALAIHESKWGQSDLARDKNNIFGLNAIDETPGESANYYKSIETCIIDFTKNYISIGYANPKSWRYYGGFIGNKNLGTNVKYASDPFWGEKVAQYAFKIDYRINGRSISSLREYNNYSLVESNGSYNIIDDDKNVIYSSKREGAILALAEKDTIQIEGENYYKVNCELYSSESDECGKYDWSKKGYIKADKVTVKNEARKNSNKYILGDINYDEKVDISDISQLALKYNSIKSGLGWNSYRDLNKDEIIDIFDLIIISKNIK